MGLNKRLIGAGATASGALTPSENFKAVIYTGNGGTQAITGVGFKPDFVWLKNRDGNTWHNLHNSTRGATKHLYSNASNAEDTTADGLTSFDSDGFTLGSGNGFNNSGVDFVAWCWKANGGTTSSNSDGSITSTVQANTDSGFSIIQYTGTGSAATIGHGLGVAPDIIFSKRTSSSADWVVGVSDWTKYLELNGTPGFRTASSVWNNTAPTSTVFSVAGSGGSNGSGETNIAYAFKSIDGFSKIGTYTGNGSDNGPIVETGFEPAFLMFKRTDSASAWVMIDNARDTSNPRLKYLMAQGVNSEAADLNGVDFLSNGFQIKDDYADWNTSGSPYIYIAFAADPDTEAPTLASSFNIETYTGTGASRSITGLGFGPGLVWIKHRDGTGSHSLTDVVRGDDLVLQSNETSAEASGQINLDSDGFTIRNDNALRNSSGQSYVAWNWKADDNEPTIFGGPAKAVYKFEDNANDVTGSFNGTASNVSYVTGKFNKAAEFNGSSSKITSTAGISGNPVFSISFWIYPTDYNGTPIMFGNNSSGEAFLTFINSSYKLNFGRWGDSLGDSTASVPQNTWTHIAIANNAGNVQLYINGVADLSFSTTYSIANTNFYIGAANSTQYFDGKIDQVRIYNGVVSDIGVAELYAETVSDNDDLELGGPPEILVSANANAGFSIVKFEKQFSSSVAEKIPHGLSAAPTMIILKRTDGTEDWYVYHTSLGNAARVQLNSSDAKTTGTNVWGQTNPSATVFTVESFNAGNAIAYCFHDVAGYQKFGSYAGDGSTQSITTGFKVDFLLIKESDGTDSWELFDSRRGVNKVLYPNGSNAEGTTSNLGSFNSNGFTVSSATSVNENGKNYIYWAIAKNVPSNTTLANSFKAVQWDGDGSTNAITGLGFRPDLVWLKNQEATTYYNLSDSVRGALKYLPSNADTIEETTQNSFMSFDSDGFTVGSANGFNNANKKFVAWCWKAGNTWQSNLDGSIGSTINANTGNGFSIVKYTGTGSTATIGHGLGATPEWIVVKAITATDNSNWAVYHSSVGNTKALKLSTNASEDDQDGYWNDTSPTSSVFTVKNYAVVNQSGKEYIAYCWAPKSGFSSFGNYTGNATAGRNITVGFQPDWILTKRTDANDNWRLYDSVRQHSNAFDLPAYINDASEGIYGSGAANNTGVTGVTSTAFTLGNGNLSNGNGHEYVYMAFKHN